MVLVEILLEDVVVGVYDINHLMIRRGDLMIVWLCLLIFFIDFNFFVCGRALMQGT